MTITADVPVRRAEAATLTLFDLFRRAADRLPDRTAIEVQRADRVEAYTYRELRRMAAVAAAELAGLGVRRGDRCALLADNDAQWCAMYLGIAQRGAVAVPLDTAYKSHQLLTLLRDSGARVIATAPAFLPRVVAMPQVERATLDVVLLHGAEPAYHSFERWLERTGRGGHEFGDPTSPATTQDPAVILYTSGTTSDPKGVVLTHANLVAESEAVLQVVHVDERDCILSVLPLFHALAQVANLLLPLTVGARVVFLETVNTTELLRALRERGVSAFCCVPQFFYLIHQRVRQQVGSGGRTHRALFRALAGLNGWLRSRLGINIGPVVFKRVHAVFGSRMRLLVTGGSRFDPTIGRELYELGLSIRQAYGLTETSGGAVVSREGDGVLEAVGHPLPGVDVKIVPQEVGAGAPGEGEIAIRGPIVMPGYYQRSDATAAVMQDGWLMTGDLGRVDEDGRVYVTGRKKDVIVLSSGKNIYPEEIEAHYEQSPFIKEICVLGIERPDAPAAERLYGIIVPDFEQLRGRRIVNAREIIRFEVENLSVRLPSHKRILGYEIDREDLPRTTTRKLKRFEIERRVRERGNRAEAGRATAAPVAPAIDDPVAAEIVTAISEATGRSNVALDGNLELDLGLDSMERVELLATLEERFGTKVAEETAQCIYTVRELVTAIRAGTPAGEARAADTWSSVLQVEPEMAIVSGLLDRKPVFAPVAFAASRVVYLLARVMTRFTVRGLEHVPTLPPFILSPNHQGYLDPFFLVSVLPYSVFRNLFFVGASEYFETPLMRRVARLLNIVPVDPDSNLVRAMQAGAFGLRNGKVLILFPEGERSIDGTVKQFKKGAPILSHHLSAPIVPIAIRGAYEIWPRKRSIDWRALFARRINVRLEFGPPVRAADLVSQDGQTPPGFDDGRAAARLRAIVDSMWQRL